MLNKENTIWEHFFDLISIPKDTVMPVVIMQLCVLASCQNAQVVLIIVSEICVYVMAHFVTTHFSSNRFFYNPCMFVFYHTVDGKCRGFCFPIPTGNYRTFLGAIFSTSFYVSWREELFNPTLLAINKCASKIPRTGRFSHSSHMGSSFFSCVSYIARSGAILFVWLRWVCFEFFVTKKTHLVYFLTTFFTESIKAFNRTKSSFGLSWICSENFTAIFTFFINHIHILHKKALCVKLFIRRYRYAMCL